MSSQRPKNPKARTTYAPEVTRASLLAAALELFECKGYHATSVDEVVEAAGLTKGAFYHHFDSKEDLLFLIHDVYIEHSYQSCLNVMAMSLPPAERLTVLIRNAVETLIEYRPHVNIFLQERRFLVGERFEAIKAKRDVVEDIYLDTIEQGVTDGTFRADLPGRIATYGVLGMIAWATNWFRVDGEISATEIGNMMADMVLGGLVVRADN